MKNSAPIGFLDSGIGGSTVLIKSLSVLPNENYVFFSDSANCPYGDKSDDEIIERCDKIVSFLIKKLRLQGNSYCVQYGFCQGFGLS